MNINRRALAIVIILLSLIIGGKSVSNNKIPKPEQETIILLNEINTQLTDIDSAKLSGFFNAVSSEYSKSNIATNIKLQYFLSNLGKKIFGEELKGKYPNFANNLSKLIEKTIGPQTEESPLTENENINLIKLFNGLSWKFYNNANDNIFEEYKNKTISAISEYNNIINPKPDKPDNKCACNGSGYITHGDGHKTKCPCSGECKCESKQTELILVPQPNTNSPKQQTQENINLNGKEEENTRRRILGRLRR